MMTLGYALIRLSLWLSTYQPPRLMDIVAQVMALNPLAWMSLALTRLADVPLVGTVSLSLYTMAAPFLVVPAALWGLVVATVLIALWHFVVPSVIAVALLVLGQGVPLVWTISHLLGGLR